MRIAVPGSLKMLIGWAAVLLFRLVPFLPPNFDPIISTLMPFSKRYGAFSSFAFGVLSIVVFDEITSHMGVWTVVTALTYGAIGAFAHEYFKTREANTWNFLEFGIAATLLYDALTMLMGPIFLHQTWAIAILGQIPFTIDHLLSTVIFSMVLSPALYRWVTTNEAYRIDLSHLVYLEK